MLANYVCPRFNSAYKQGTYNHVGDPTLRVISYASTGEQRLKQVRMAITLSYMTNRPTED